MAEQELSTSSEVDMVISAEVKVTDVPLAKRVRIADDCDLTKETSESSRPIVDDEEDEKTKPVGDKPEESLESAGRKYEEWRKKIEAAAEKNKTERVIRVMSDVKPDSVDEKSTTEEVATVDEEKTEEAAAAEEEKTEEAAAAEEEKTEEVATTEEGKAKSVVVAVAIDEEDDEAEPVIVVVSDEILDEPSVEVAA